MIRGALVACCLLAASPAPGADVLTGRAATLYRDLSLFHDAGTLTDPAQRAFFAREAAAAGVRRIRAMTAGEKPKRLIGRQTGCGRALVIRKHVVIDVDRPKCLSLHNLAHEIAHVRVFAERCYGHGDRFYRANYRIAARFDAAFPRAARKHGSLRAAVLERARTYRNAAEGCPGNVSITD